MEFLLEGYELLIKHLNEEGMNLFTVIGNIKL
jgi:hypothetical protein